MLSAAPVALALVAAAATLMLVPAASPGAALEPRDELVFARGGEIYVRASDGAVRRLTRNRVYDGAPAWSPDGRSIVFTRAIGNDSDIYVMDSDGRNARRLAGSARGAQDLYPRFSPDGRRIVFASNRTGESDVFVMRADGRGLRRLTRGPRWVDDTQPSFSPDGRHIVFTSNRISYFNYEVFRIRAADGGGLTRLTFWGSGEDGAPGDDVSPSYSPDGKRIAFVSERGGGYAVWTMNARGGDLRRIAGHANHNVVFPRFSPDGRSLVYTAFADKQGVPALDELWTVKVDGTGRTRLGRGGSADWR
jgi:Tol biopolymer transport system component